MVGFGWDGAEAGGPRRAVPVDERVPARGDVLMLPLVNARLDVVWNATFCVLNFAFAFISGFGSFDLRLTAAHVALAFGHALLVHHIARRHPEVLE